VIAYPRVYEITITKQARYLIESVLASIGAITVINLIIVMSANQYIVSNALDEKGGVVWLYAAEIAKWVALLSLPVIISRVQAKKYS